MFSARSHKKELLDADDIPPNDLARNLYELDVINTYLGGYAVSLRALKDVLSREREEVIVDIGSGGGDTLRAVSKWAVKRNYNLKLVGVDIKDYCVSYSNAHHPGLTFVRDDYRNLLKHVPDVTVVHASLFCHHLSDDEIIRLISFARVNKLTLVINDLARHPVAYYAIRALTWMLSSSRLVKNDAPLSVLRGFKKKEWSSLIERAGATQYRVRNRWAFRHEVVVYNG
jgi:SAM-dependent methyltransferase